MEPEEAERPTGPTYQVPAETGIDTSNEIPCDFHVPHGSGKPLSYPGIGRSGHSSRFEGAMEWSAGVLRHQESQIAGSGAVKPTVSFELNAL